jgi:CIC family chloride channel protein
VGGTIIGVVGAGFRVVLAGGNWLRGELIDWARQWPAWGWVFPVAIAAALVGVARWMVKRFAPEAGGSGVQHVEAVIRGEVPFPSVAVLPVKFIGGAMAIGAGMALGREGPIVQMGSSVGSDTGRLARMDETATRDLQAAVAAAGLATAFNAPFGGAVFAFEELARRFTVRMVVITLTACAVAILIMRYLLGDETEFRFTDVPQVSAIHLLIYLALGAVLGVLGAAYNLALVRGQDIVDRVPWVPVELKAALIGGAVGLVAWFEPGLVGGGEKQVQLVLDGRFTVTTLAILFAVRWVLGPFCYFAGTPGGVFAPLMLVGAAFGALSGEVLRPWVPQTPASAALAVVGMAAFFAAVVRAPLTGAVLLAEMTGTTRLLVPLMLATTAATVVPTLMKSEPIYDTLRVRMLRRAQQGTKP